MGCNGPETLEMCGDIDRDALEMLLFDLVTSLQDCWSALTVPRRQMHVG